ncbi:MAG: HupE/UreJ family protein [Oceanococcaceae bacterium]
MRTLRRDWPWSRGVALGLCGLFVTVAQAHTGGTLSHSDWTRSAALPETDSPPIAITARMRVTAADFRHLALGQDAGALGRFLRDLTRLQSESGPCPPRDLTQQALGSGQWLLRWSLDCPAPPEQLTLAWLEHMPGHLHFLQQDHHSQVLRGGEPPTRHWISAQEQSPGAVLLQQWHHGLRHIAGGWDHLAFLLGLLLLARGAAHLAGLVTGFTLGHSLALLLAIIQGWRPEALLVELTIAASVLLVGMPQTSAGSRLSARLIWIGVLLLVAAHSPAAWLLWLGLAILGLVHLSAARVPPAGVHENGPRGELIMTILLAALFGLLHGFGFASAVLADAQDAAQLWAVLLGFNLGVETGQLLLVIPAALLLWRARQHAQLAASTIQMAVMLVGSVALGTLLTGA